MRSRTFLIAVSKYLLGESRSGFYLLSDYFVSLSSFTNGIAGFLQPRSDFGKFVERIREESNRRRDQNGFFAENL